MSLESHILNSPLWWKKQLDFRHLKSPVTRIHFVAHPSNETLPDPSVLPTNHWTAFFTISNDLSIRIEVVPTGSPDQPGMVIVESKKYGLTTSAAHVAPADVSPGTTVEDLLTVIVNRKRDNYTFAPVGEGCRYWLSVLSGDFVEAEIISKKDSDTAVEAMEMYWAIGMPPVPRPMARGSFNA